MSNYHCKICLQILFQNVNRSCSQNFWRRNSTSEWRSNRGYLRNSHCWRLSCLSKTCSFSAWQNMHVLASKILALIYHCNVVWRLRLNTQTRGIYHCRLLPHFSSLNLDCSDECKKFGVEKPPCKRLKVAIINTYQVDLGQFSTDSGFENLRY